MSNHLAVATVTAALSKKIQEALSLDVEGATVRVGRPEEGLAQGDKPVVNLYLYQVVPNPTLRNTRMPVRGGNGELIEKPMVALNLHYLISFYGKADDFSPERILASTVRILDQEPLLQRSLLEAVINKENSPVEDSDLHQAEEIVRIHPSALNLEEMSKLWSVLFQVPYALSAAYECRYVLVEATEDVVPGLPVTRPDIVAIAGRGPSIFAIEAKAGPPFPLVWGGVMHLRGQGFGALGLELQVGETTLVMNETAIAPESILVPLVPATFGGAELPAGMYPIRAVLPAPEGAPVHLKRPSDSVPLILRSTVSTPADPVAAGKLTVNFSPEIVEGQEVGLFLDERTAGSPRSYLLAPDEVASADYPVTSLTFPIDDVAGGTYLLRAQVDGISSALMLEDDVADPAYRQIIGPEVAIP